MTCKYGPAPSQNAPRRSLGRLAKLKFMELKEKKMKTYRLSACLEREVESLPLG